MESILFSRQCNLSTCFHSSKTAISSRPYEGCIIWLECRTPVWIASSVDQSGMIAWLMMNAMHQEVSALLRRGMTVRDKKPWTHPFQIAFNVKQTSVRGARRETCDRDKSWRIGQVCDHYWITPSNRLSGWDYREQEPRNVVVVTVNFVAVRHFLCCS